VRGGNILVQMGESKSVQQSAENPVTQAELLADLRALDLGADARPVLVHTSLSALGWVCGGAQAVVETLVDSAGAHGTVVMPAFSAGLSDPAHWTRPPVPEEWWQVIRDSMPAFDAARTPTRAIGVVAELFRTCPGVRRSAHPQSSLAAHGPLSEEILHSHPLEDEMGDGSPLDRLYGLDARILLLGATHASNSSLHFAEHLASWSGKRTAPEGAPILRDGKRVWAAFESLDYDSSDFARIGADFGERAQSGKAGRGMAQIMSMCELVDLGVAWMNEHRPGSLL